MKDFSKKTNNADLKKTIENYILDFYDTYYKTDRLKLYSYLNTSFQREIPLNYFLIHSDYDIDLGTILEVTSITFEKDYIAVEITVKINNKKRDIVINVISDFGGWKIDGDSIYRGNYS
ncbi:hypothetical protein [Sedimentibacter sp.]|uniref:hypothetical protein n=1 Tax=Sedimentibacter sp. TaxID=1960295 RepID=UPI0028A9155E|nr:hypothetical protein [Sedimentibacter sp.]